MVIKATTPPTMPMMTESMLVSPVDCLGCGDGWGTLALGSLLRVVGSGSQMMSTSDSVAVVREVE